MAEPTTEQAKREGWAVALTDLLFPHKKHRDPDVVQYFYDWSLQVQGTAENPFGIHHGRHYADSHAAALATVHMLHTPKYKEVVRDLRQGKVTAARHAHPVGNATPLPFELDNAGQWDPKKHESHVTVGGVIKHLPGAAGDVASGIGSDVAGIGGWLGKNLTLVVIVVVLIVVLKK